MQTTRKNRQNAEDDGTKTAVPNRQRKDKPSKPFSSYAEKDEEDNQVEREISGTDQSSFKRADPNPNPSDDDHDSLDGQKF